MQDVEKPVSEMQEERRRFVRVQDALGLHIQKLVERPAAGQSDAVYVPTKVRKQDKYAIEGYADVRRDFPAVATYITDLEERIRELLLDGDAAASKPTHKVSLSAGGISFSDKRLYVPGEHISKTLTLFPTGRRIGTDAIIVGANDSDEVMSQDNPTYRANFIRMSDADRLAIEAHVEKLLSKRNNLNYR